jgi:spore germination protein (amino acid permease)
MKNVVKFGHSEAAAIAIVFVGVKAFLGYPRVVIELGSTAAWLVVLISGMVGIGAWLVISALLARFPGKSIMVITELVLGPFLGIGVNIIFFLYVMITNGILLRQFSEAIILTILPEAPISSLTFLFIIPVWLAAYLGIEAISRSAYISLPFITAGVTAVLLALYPYWNPLMLLPLLGEGIFPTVKYGFLSSTVFGEIFILAVLAPFFAFTQKKLKNVGLFSLGFVMVFFILIVNVYLMVFPLPVATENLLPFYQLARTIYLGRYFQRVEAVFVLFWTFTAFLRLSLGIIVAAFILQDAFKLPYYRPLLPALCVLAFSLALTPADVMQNAFIEYKIRLIYGWLFSLALPCGIWAVALLRRKGEGHEGENT